MSEASAAGEASFDAVELDEGALSIVELRDCERCDDGSGLVPPFNTVVGDTCNVCGGVGLVSVEVS